MMFISETMKESCDPYSALDFTGRIVTFLSEFFVHAGYSPGEGVDMGYEASQGLAFLLTEIAETISYQSEKLEGMILQKPFDPIAANKEYAEKKAQGKF